MLYEEKLAGFLTGSNDYELLGREDLAPLNITIRGASPNILFERETKLESSVLIGGMKTTSFIGAYSYMNDGGYLRGNVFIGRFCSIGRRVSLGAGQHAMDQLSTSSTVLANRHPPVPYSDSEQSHIRTGKPHNPFVVIESDVWVGDGSVVLPGVRIGVGAVIAANAVVNRNVDPYSIVGGVPAKVIGQRFSDELKSELIGSGWWNRPIEMLKEMPVNNVFAFLKSNREQTHKRSNLRTYRLRGGRE